MLFLKAFAQVGKDEIVEVNFKDPTKEVTDTMRKDILFHCSNPRFLFSFIINGMLCSPEGCQSRGQPTMYASPLRKCALGYNWSLIFPDGKEFTLIVCFRGERRPGKWGKKNDGNNQQRMLDHGAAEILYLQFYCINGESYKDTAIVTNAKHIEKARKKLEARCRQCREKGLVRDANWRKQNKPKPTYRSAMEKHLARQRRQTQKKKQAREAKAKKKRKVHSALPPGMSMNLDG